ncbi:MAG: ribonuclease J [Rickettsiales bacterium]|nr:ribonuclease J [Rickettsiales bacterium]
MMSFDIKKHKNDLIFIPLGGAGEIGMNVNLYQYKGKWLMVDLGAGFTDDYFPGVDLMVAEIDYISNQKNNLLGIVLTHAHEDHLGAVQYLWKELRCPIYTTKFTASFLRAKLKETDFWRDIEIIEIEENSVTQIGPFAIETVPLSHSTPEMQSLMIRTDLGNVFHTGDWKFDHNPLIGDPNDQKLLGKLGDEGVLAMIGDSTNVFNDTYSGSEGDLRESIIELVKGCKKMVVITTFASNVARMETILKAAEAAGRRVVMAGRSLWRILEAAQSSGYLLDIPPVLRPDKMGNIKREKLLVLSTGCQGEPMAATTKMANGSHPNLKLLPGDTIIFSSKIIPGNEKKIFRLLNQLIAQQIEVFTEKEHFVHVSGHPSQGELKLMYELIRPQVAVPVHGELMHIHEHIRLAKSWGVKNSVQVTNGDVIRLAPGKSEVIDKVESGYLGIDGHFLLPGNSSILKMRRRMQESGVVFMVLMLNDRNQMVMPPVIRAPGVLDMEEDRSIVTNIAKEVHKALGGFMETVSKKKQRSDVVESTVRTAIRGVLKREVGKNPMIEVELVYL